MFLTLLIAFFSLIVLMIVHEFGHFIIAKKFGVKVEEFGVGYPPRIFGKKIGETLYSINAIPLGAFVKIYGEEGESDHAFSFANLAVWKRVLIVLGGVIAFWIAAMFIFSAVFMMGAAIPIGDRDVGGMSANVNIVAVSPGSPAESAGLKTGDILEKLTGGETAVVIEKVGGFVEAIEANKGKEIILTVVRGGQQIELALTPRVDHPSDQGPTGLVIERFASVIEKYPWYVAPLKGVKFTGEMTLEAIRGIYRVVFSLVSGGGMPEGAEFAGPVGITIFLTKAAGIGAGFFLYFIGSICVLLAIFNLFPIPALDGGKLLFLTIEAVRKKPVPPKAEQIITVVFFSLLIVMAIFVTVKFDIPRLADFWKASL